MGVQLSSSVAIGAAVCVLCLFGVACGPDVPDLECPDGTERVGSKPPTGLKEQCVDPNRKSVTGLPFKQGPVRHWWPSGRLRSEGEFNDDLPHGFFRWWFTNGKASAEGAYVNGKKHGMWTEWSYGGALASKTPYKMGRIDGTRTFFRTDGTVQRVYQYRGGVLVERPPKVRAQ